MTTITRAPLTFWSCGGDVLMRVPGCAPIALTEPTIADLLDVMMDETLAAHAAGDRLAWANVGDRNAQLIDARNAARSWRRASGDIPRAA
jgi:hypothetical protein